MLSKTSRDGAVQELLLEACHDVCAAAAAAALGQRHSASPFSVHMRGGCDAMVAALQHVFATASAIDRSARVILSLGLMR